MEKIIKIRKEKKNRKEKKHKKNCTQNLFPLKNS